MISVIVPVFNRIKLLPFTVDSILQQTNEHFEIIAVDDDSTDGSYEWLLAEANKKEQLIVQKNKSGIKGPSAARNEGLRIAKGNFIIFLDSDDLLEPFCLEQRLNVMKCEPELSFAVFLQKTFETDPAAVTGIFNRRPQNGDSYLNMFIRNDNPWQTMAVIWKKEALLKLKGFDPDFFVMEDPELHTRALLNTDLKFRVCTELPPDNLYRIGHMDGNKTETFYTNSILYRFAYLKKIYGLIGNSELAETEKSIAYANWTRGVKNLFRNFLLARMNQFITETKDFLDWAEKNHSFSPAELLKFRFMVRFWVNDSIFLKKTRLRGVLYRLLFNY